jgi:uncharacterized membrane protein
MEYVRAHRAALALLAALLVPLGVAAAIVPFRGSFANTAAALVFVCVIEAVAIVGNRVDGVIASISSALWFDFFLTPPYLRFTISHRPDLETTICILVVGVIVTELAARSRHHRRRASAEKDYVAMVNELTTMAAGSAAASQIVEKAASSLVELLDLRSCRFVVLPADPPLARIQPDGTVVHVGLHWPVGEIGIPGPEAEILAEWRGRVLGSFVLTPTPGLAVSVEQRVVAASLAQIVGATLSDRRLVA